MKLCKWIAMWALAFSQPLCCKAEIKFQFTDLGTLGGSSSDGYALNNLGLVVGGSNLTGEPSYTGFRHAFLNDGSAHNLGTLGGSYSVAHGINDHGVVVGESSTANGGGHTFLYDGAMHDLHALGNVGSFKSTVATAINNAGQVVGYVSESTFQHAFLYDGTLHDLTPNFPSGVSGQAVAINTLGEVLINGTWGPHLYRPGIGTAYYGDVINSLGGWDAMNANGINDFGVIVGSGRHGSQFANAYLYDGTLQDLGRLDGSVASILFDVNNRGDAVGHAVSYGWGDSGVTVIYSPLFYSKETGLVDLNTLVGPGLALAKAVAINDAGQITGTTYNGHAFLLTPLVPEPNGITAIAIASTAIVGCRRRHRGTGRANGSPAWSPFL